MGVGKVFHINTNYQNFPHKATLGLKIKVGKYYIFLKIFMFIILLYTFKVVNC